MKELGRSTDTMIRHVYILSSDDQRMMESAGIFTMGAVSSWLLADRMICQ